MIPTPEQLAELETHFQICTFPPDPECDNCEAPIEDGRTWWQRTNYEVEEGNYYCSKCGLERIKELKEFYSMAPEDSEKR